ncbi:hypothetical protein MYAM1_001142 [Malassezia yamatoensis]|uniref:Fumarylacetoacetase-like C-terminal domain-containing protein n=1 Tax=Malassezia yamatoensis TaxID=253288 RepID=A0AAJ5YQT3_9BASI|nr:hypothetical protein MYAM1_001142 [Malassezia yamatoensis]
MAATFRQTGRKIVAIGRNFADHAKELNNTVPKEPFFFLKPTSSYISSGQAIEIPKGVNAHYEVELAVVMGKQGRDIDPKHADEYVGGYALAIDMTARNVQDQVKKQGLPWSTAKGFDTFTPISEFVPKKLIQDPSDVQLWLKINDQLKQNGNTQDMIFNVSTLLAHVSSIMTLEAGDVVLTGK